MENKHTQKLLQKSRELFMKFGIKNLTMDDIARELCISKKTIYQSVDNKAELVEKVMQDYLQEDNANLEEIYAKSKDAIDEMIAIIGYIIQSVQGLNSTAVHDMKVHYPQAWSLYNKYRFDNTLRRVTLNMERGVKEGVYRDEINIDILSRIYVGGIDVLLNQEFFPAKQYQFLDTYKEFLGYHLRGIVTLKGLKLLEANDLHLKIETK